MVSKGKCRLDQRLVRDGFAGDLRQAQGLILAGQVVVDDQRVDKTGFLVRDGQAVRIKGQDRFVSRGGEKLWGAVEDLGVKSLFQNAVVLDCGASTGGFTDCALQLGAQKVYALDVGTNQLAWKLRTDVRVVVMEQTDVRQVAQVLDPQLRLILADISFNSIDRLLPALVQVAPEAEVHFLLLVKPQFELLPEEVPPGGVVTDPQVRAKALEQAKNALQREGLQFMQSVDSRLPGREGNVEIFVLAKR